MNPSTLVPGTESLQVSRPLPKMTTIDLSKEERCRLYLEQSGRIARNFAILQGLTRRHEKDCNMVKGNTQIETPVDKNLQREFYKKPLAPGNCWPFPPGHSLDWQTSKCLPTCVKCDVKNKAYEFIASYFTNRKERKDSGTFETVFPDGYPQDSILDRRSRPSNCPDCERIRTEERNKFFVDQLFKYTTEQMNRRDVANISTENYPPGSIFGLIAAYVKENINFDWVSRGDLALEFLEKRKKYYEKSEKTEDVNIAQCFAVLYNKMDVIILQDITVLRLQRNAAEFSGLEREWLTTIFPEL